MLRSFSHASRVDEALLVLFDLIEWNEVVVLACKNQNVDISARCYRRQRVGLKVLQKRELVFRAENPHAVRLGPYLAWIGIQPSP